MQSSEEWEDIETQYSLAVNLRPQIAKEVSVDYSGLYISLLGANVTITQAAMTSGEQFWKLAAESTSRMRQQIKGQRYLDGYLHVFSGTPEQNVDLELNSNSSNPEHRVADLVYTTSYGAWEFPFDADDLIKPIAIYTNSSIHKCGEIFPQQLLTVNGKLTWTIAYSQRVVSEETARRFTDIMFDILNRNIKS